MLSISAKQNFSSLDVVFLICCKHFELYLLYAQKGIPNLKWTVIEKEFSIIVYDPSRTPKKEH